jgi:membrane associated rhomboid family serine protease
MMRYNASGDGLSGIPTVVKNLIILNALVMLVKATGITGMTGIQFDTLFGLHFPSSPLFRPWQILTHMFVHAGPGTGPGNWYLHILFNMLGLYMFGPRVEYRWGSQKFLMYYLLCGLGSAILYVGWIWYGARQELAMLTPSQLSDTREILLAYVNGTLTPEMSDPSPEMTRVFTLWWMPMVGASGALFGILLAFGMLYPNVKLMMLFFPVPIPARWFVVIYALIELFGGLANIPGDNVAHFAHLGGMIAGFFLVRWYERNNHDHYQGTPW